MRDSWRKIIVVLGVASLGLLLGGCSLGGKRVKFSALQVDSTPRSTVFLNGEHVGQTRFYDDKLTPGDYTIKLVPDAVVDSQGRVTVGWEGQVKLNEGVLTVVNRDLGVSEALSAGEVLTLEPQSSSDVESLVVITSPDAANVLVDGQPRGAAPLAVEDLSEGDHEILVSLAGYVERRVKVKLVRGNKLTVSIQLAQEDKTEEKEDEAQKKEAEKVARLRVLDTPTGWLRVREGNSVSTDELAKVSPGDEFDILDESEGWYKIEYEDGKEGWISGQYAEKLNGQEETPTPSPSLSLTPGVTAEEGEEEDANASETVTPTP